MSPQPLKLLLCSLDRGLLRQLSRFLGAFRYQVEQAARPELAAAVLEWGQPDVLIVDSQPSMSGAGDLCRKARQAEPRVRPYVFLLVHQPDSDELNDALEAGADDFLAKPIVYGELLVRLRAGVRTLEFERRLGEQQRLEPLSGLPSRSAFLAGLQRAVAAASGRKSLGTCVVAEIDYLRQMTAAYGRAAGEAVVRAAAGKLSALCRESHVLAHFGGGQFAFWLPGTSEEAAAEWADNARLELESTGVDVAGTSLPCTASFGVAAWRETVQTAHALLERAVEALDGAKSSGGQCVARFGQFDDETRTWEQLAAPGKLFEQTLARHVMTPWPLVLQLNQPADHAAALFRQTGLGALPVVDPGGRFVGLVLRQRVAAEPSSNGRHSRPVAGAMTTDVPTCDEEASFTELIGLLEHGPHAMAVVLRRGWPAGFVTLKGLAAMSEPLERRSFRGEVPCSNTSDYLLVCDPRSDEA